MAALDAKYLEGLLDRIRQHDNARTGEIRQLKAEIEALQTELAKKTQTIKQLRAQVHTLTEFKRTIVKSVHASPSPDDVTLDDYVDREATTVSPRERYAAHDNARRAPSPPAHDLSTSMNDYDKSPHGHVGVPKQSDAEGHEFFMMAKKQLSYQQFQQFLQVIKQFNQHEKNKEQTLAMARDVFGSHEGLYKAFHGLLTRASTPYQ